LTKILRERADLIGTDDPWQQFNKVTEGFTREDYAALWEWCRNRLSCVLDAHAGPDQTADAH